MMTLFKLWIAWISLWAMICFGIYYSKSKHFKSFYADGIKVWGVVHSVDSELRHAQGESTYQKIPHYRTIIKYKARGRVITYRTGFSTTNPDVGVGDKVKMVYAPDDPHNAIWVDLARTKINKKFWLIGWLFMSIFPPISLLFMLGILNFIGQGLKKSFPDMHNTLEHFSEEALKDESFAEKEIERKKSNFEEYLKRR